MPGAGDASLLERNLAALERGSPDAAAAIRRAVPRADVTFVATDEIGPDGRPALSPQVGACGGARALASRRRPLDEARRAAERADIAESGCLVVCGFGAGYFVGAVAARMRRAGVVVCFEPDVALLRAVLERIDHSSWIESANVALLTDPDDTAAMTQSLRNLEAVVGLGVSLLADTGARERLGALADRFESNFKRVVEAVSTTVVTTMAQIDVTIRNLTANLDRYVTCEGIDDLKDLAATAGGKASAAGERGEGRPAIVVSAGPSLRRNVDLLADPAVRRRFILIAVQTVLKPLLARGIRPDFVTALDYHEISRRFYEGLTPADVDGVTLVVEPKANPAILDAFPGRIRCVADPILDELLGPEMARERGDGRASLPPGATVAHLAYYLARHLGCDPVVLVGQDLGFTDGQYYAAGAAIHDVWAGELNPFNTLEMLEWQRIARMRPNLRRATDSLGRPIYTDVQMNAYLAQFERDFKRDAEAGLTIIDATEGGVAKRGANPMPLREVIARYAAQPASPDGPALPPAPARAEPAARLQRLRRLAERLGEVRRGVWQVGDLSRQAAARLREMLDHHGDQDRVNALIARVEGLRDRVQAICPAYALVHRLNQTGAFRRFRADRAIHLDESLSDLQRQRRQIERDVDNVTWLADAANALGTILEDALASLPVEAGGRGAPKRVRDPAPPPFHASPHRVPTPGPRGSPSQGAPVSSGADAVSITAERDIRVAAVIPVLPDRSGLGTPRDLARPFLLGATPLRMTLLRLARCRRLAGAILLADDPDQARALAAGPVPGLAVSVRRADLGPLRQRLRAVGPARLWADTCWRGGIGGMTVFDELLDAPLLLEALAAGAEGAGRGPALSAALLVGADWALVDPVLCDAVIERHAERPDAHRLAFTQAPPGLCGCVVSRPLAERLAAAWHAGGAGAASIATVLSYVPSSPTLDPIASPACVAVDPAVRDAHLRFVPDSPARRSILAGALAGLAEGVLAADARTIAHLVAERAESAAAAGVPQQLVLELCTGRRTSGRRAHWERGSIGAVERAPMPRGLAERLLVELADTTAGAPGRPDAAVSFAGAGDPLLHPDLFDLVAAARRAGAGAVHVRTDLLCDHETLDRLLDCGADVISVDLMADSPATYRSIMGIDRFDRARDNLLRLLEARARAAPAGGLPRPWIVPRLTRCDAAYADVESFFDRWLIAAGAAVIDPLPLSIPGERIEPLPRPAGVRRRDLRRRMTVFSDGSVPIGEKDLHAGAWVSGGRVGGVVGNASSASLATLWRDLWQARRALERQHGHAQADAQMAS
jgi:hypothetical protein